MTHEDFVTYEQADKLKELDFDWECNHYYHTQTKECLPVDWFDYDGYIDAHDLYTSNPPKGMISYRISAPTLAQVQKWLREVKKEHLIVNIDRWITSTPYRFEIYQEVGENIIHQYTQNDFPTYEQALSAGIDTALKLLIEK